MGIRLIGGLTAVALWTGAAVAPAQGQVNLVLRPDVSPVGVGDEVRIGLFAVSTTGSDQEFSGIDVVLIWDHEALKLEGIEDSPLGDRFPPGFRFPWDEKLDGLNADCGPDEFCVPYTGLPFNDGDAFYQSGFLSPPSATPEGLRVTTFLFEALAPTDFGVVGMVRELSPFSRTQILAPGNIDLTGLLLSTRVVIEGPMLWVADVHVPPGRTAEVWVYGSIDGEEAFGVTITLELQNEGEGSGVVEFTPAPPVDIVANNNPWDGIGSFTPFDTDMTGSPALNGADMDNGSFTLVPTTFFGPLASFPVEASFDAAGHWKTSLTLSTGIQSQWERKGPPSGLDDGSIVIVDPGDGDGDGMIDVRDFSEMQNCFTGKAQGAPAYPTDPALRCVVYDMDGDGLIDWTDHALFLDQMLMVVP